MPLCSSPPPRLVAHCWSPPTPHARAGGGQPLRRAATLPAQQLAQAAALSLPKLLPHFPATAPAVRPPPQVLELLGQFNLQAAELLAACVAGGVQQAPRGAGAPAVAAGAGGGGPEPGLAQPLVDYISQLLACGTTVPEVDELAAAGARSAAPAGAGGAGAGGSKGGASAGGLAASQSSYAAALAAARQVLPWLPPQARHALLAEVGGLSARLPARSPVQAGCVRLQHSMLLAYVRQGVGDAQLEGELCTWLAGAPKLLWALGVKRPATSRVS